MDTGESALSILCCYRNRNRKRDHNRDCNRVVETGVMDTRVVDNRDRQQPHPAHYNHTPVVSSPHRRRRRVADDSEDVGVVAAAADADNREEDADARASARNCAAGDSPLAEEDAATAGPAQKDAVDSVAADTETVDRADAEDNTDQNHCDLDASHRRNRNKKG